MMNHSNMVKGLVGLSALSVASAWKGPMKKRKACDIGREWTAQEIVDWRFPPKNGKKCLECAVGKLTAVLSWEAARSAFTKCGADWQTDPPAGIVPPQDPTSCDGFPNAEFPSPIDWQSADGDCLNCAVATLGAGTGNAIAKGTDACTVGEDDCTYQQARGAFAACGSPAELWAEDVLPELEFPLP